MEVKVKTKPVDIRTVPPDTLCASCGRRADDHAVRHPFTVVDGLAQTPRGEN